MRQRYGDLGESGETTAAETPRGRQVLNGLVVGVCLTTALLHVALVFLHVAPLNPVSKHYGRQISAWINPLFQQNWLLFAPNPDANRTQIFARTARMTAAGHREVSDWVDISAVDKAGVRHSLYPSRTAQHMLRRAWSAYQSTHPENDESDAWSIVWEKYLRNIAVQRVAAHDPGPFQSIRLKVVTQPIAPLKSDDTTQPYSTEPYTRVLPWWNVTPDGS